MRRPAIALLVLGFGALPAVADAPITLAGQIYFQWRPSPDPRSTAALCGFLIFGKHDMTRDRKVEWEVNIDEIVLGNQRAVGVSAGTFTLVSDKRIPRAAITDLVFSFADSDVTVPVHLIGNPNRDNGVQGIVDFGRRDALFDALSNNKYVTVSFKYADGSADAIKQPRFALLNLHGGSRHELATPAPRLAGRPAFTRAAKPDDERTHK